VRAAVSALVERFPAGFSSPFETARAFASAEMNGFPKDYYQTYLTKIRSVTIEEVKRVARDRCRPKDLVFVFVGDIPAIKEGDPLHPVAAKDLGPVTDVPLPDPLTLKRP